MHRVISPDPDLALDVVRLGTYLGTLAFELLSVFLKRPASLLPLLSFQPSWRPGPTASQPENLSQCPQLRVSPFIWSSGNFCYKGSRAWGKGHSDPQLTFAFSTYYLNCLSLCLLICEGSGQTSFMGFSLFRRQRVRLW